MGDKNKSILKKDDGSSQIAVFSLHSIWKYNDYYHGFGYVIRKYIVKKKGRLLVTPLRWYYYWDTVVDAGFYDR